ncbi:kremen protein 1-like [Saccoglossus kowalevskii]
MEARTVCKQLGFVNVMWLWGNSEFGVSDLPMSVCDISCDVSSTSLNDCTISWTDTCTCTAMYQAGVTCYFPGFLGRYKEKEPMRMFPVSTRTEIPASEITISICIHTCREQGKSIAVLSSADECYCGDENTDYWQYGEAIPGEMINEYTEYGSQQCSGDTGTDPYKQACAGDWQFDVYDTYIGACGGDYTTDTGYIYSPNFPGFYPPNQSCIWTITVSDNNIIELSILMMRLSSGDFLTIRDGNVHSTTLGIYTGSYVDVVKLNSSSNALWLHFFSNHNGTDKGFVIAYQDTSLQLCTTPTVTDHLIISSAHQNDIFNHGDVITFTCKSGYGLIGESLISCQDDGQWSNNIPTCTG